MTAFERKATSASNRCSLEAIRRWARRAVRQASLLGASLYWRWAARRAMSDQALLRRLAGPWKSVTGFLEHLASRPADSWLLPHPSPEQAAARLAVRYPQEARRVRAAAQAACIGEFDLLGHTARYPGAVDWQRDPLSNWRWPLRYREQLDGLVWSPDPPADLTLVWELNRHQHFASLGMAYWLSGEDRYTEAFVHQVQSWIDQNPWQHGVHWHSSLEVALRAIAWTVAFQFFRRSVHLRGPFGAAFFKSLYRQVDFVRSHLQTRRSTVPNNHLIAELAALAIVGAVFPEFAEAVAWRRTGMELLARYLPLQTHPDGVNKEQASGYHRFVAELLCLLVSLGRRGLLPRVPLLEETLEKMLDYLLFSTAPAGETAPWGDCGYTRALGIDPGEHYRDARWLLAVGAVLYRRPDWKHVAREFGFQAFWLLGEEALAAWEGLPARPPARSSRAFPQGGVYVLRDGWSRTADLLVFRCGPFGLGGAGKCSHAHCDLLSPLLWMRGRALLVDPGTYAYSGPWRNPFRLTAAHNTLLVDRREQADPLVPFGWSRLPTAECLAWLEGRRVVGSLQAAPGVRHTRQVIHREAGIWQIDDRLEGAGCHHLVWNFHLAPDLSTKWVAASRELVVAANGQRFALILPPAGVDLQVKTGWLSPSYRKKESALIVEGRWWGEFSAGTQSFSWEFLYAGDCSRRSAV